MARRARRGERQAPGWVWMLFGLALGLSVALAVYMRSGRSSDSPSAPLASAPQPVGSDTPRSTESPPSTAQRFDFYELLPQFEVVIPEVESPARPGNAARVVDEPGRYFLQVGSFAAAQDADRMRANVALLGIESHIQRVTIDDDVFHRVRIGPIDELDELKRVQAQLRAARVDSLLIKVAN